MALQDKIARLRKALRVKSGRAANPLFPFDRQELDSSEAARLCSGASNELEKIIYGHNGRVVHKWLHFPKIYEKEFSHFRGTDVNFLELGVFRGGSLEVWRKYFGASAKIAGIDVDPACADFVDPPNQVFIGSQADRAFLNSVIDEIGTPDIVLDDASHVAPHQRSSFQSLFPLMKAGGLYAIEDLHTAYWPGHYGGGYRRAGTAIELAKSLVDDMHAWYHDRGCSLADASSIASVRFYDSIVVIEKGDDPMPSHIKVGRE